MTIHKFFHSCLLIVEEHGKRLLIDPGLFSFIEKKITPEDIGAVDAILLTHKHPDHFYLEALKTIASLNSSTTIITHDEIGALLEPEGLAWKRIAAGETLEVQGFRIKAFAAEHGPIPSAIPHNLAYVINEKVLHPGDSLSVQGIDQCDVLALPVAAPWLRIVDALAFARALRPKHVLPIHDGFVKEFMLDRIHEMCGAVLGADGITFHRALLGEEIEVGKMGLG